ncbi:MAG: DNA helicase RecQ [Spirochaetes bacterium]|nr:DNA helicase RecQ [Spirochaetota bacterium]
MNTTGSFTISESKQLLKNIFGFEDFRYLQEKVIANVLKKEDTLTVMPTGSGKSLCYQIPALQFSGLTIVVSPLIALMKDQVEQLVHVGIHAAFLNSSLTLDQYEMVVQQIVTNELKILFVAPETLLKPRVLNLLRQKDVSLIAIDEAHCISAWGHDFRPEYRQLIEVRKEIPQATCLALTATATPRVRDDIQKCLGFTKENVFISSFDRPNLHLQVIAKKNPIPQVALFLEQHEDQSGIIYCLTRKSVDQLASVLQESGHSVLPYHAGMTDKERIDNQEAFIKDDVKIMVATIAFGMGINKPDVRFVIHYDLPKNLEGYYQEIGRAGRDGLPASCLLLFSYQDVIKIKYFIDQKSAEEQLVARHQLDEMISYAENHICRRIPLLHYFGEKYEKEQCDLCDNCQTDDREKTEVTVGTQKLLSCIYRTGQIYGAAYISDVLRGSQSQKVLSNNHDQLTTYGIGKEYSRQQWMNLTRQLVQQNFIEKDKQFGSLRLTSKALSFFKQSYPIFAFMEDEKIQKEDIPLEAETLNGDVKLLKLLKNLRKEIADSEAVPPYVIFHDKTLIDMATYYPLDKKAMLSIHGIGQAKWEKYGQQFIDFIQDYCNTEQIDLLKVPKKQHNQIIQITKEEKEKTRKFMQVSQAFVNNPDIHQLLQNYHIKLKTVLKHFYTYLLEGYSLPAEPVLKVSQLSEQQIEQIIKQFQLQGTKFLRPVYDFFKGTISFDELDINRIYVMAKDNKNISE